MEKLDARAGCRQRVRLGSEGAACQKEDEWPQPLATGSHQPQYQLGDSGVVDASRFLQALLHLSQLGSHCCQDAARPDINHSSPRNARGGNTATVRNEAPSDYRGQALGTTNSCQLRNDPYVTLAARESRFNAVSPASRGSAS